MKDQTRTQLKGDLRRFTDALFQLGSTVIDVLPMKADAQIETRDISSDREPPMTTKEVAEYLRVSIRSIHQWIADEGFPKHRVGKRLRFFQSEIDDWTMRNKKTIETRKLRVIK